MRRPIGSVSCALGICLAANVGCRKTDSSGKDQPPSALSSSAVPTVARVPQELSGQVLAKVGDRTITLADYALVLDRMDRFERLRYQTPERRRALLDELIHVELLAREAERRGLDELPETRAFIDQLLRDEVRRRLRGQLPQASEIPEAEVRAYYNDHRAEFVQPERRRVAVLATKDATLAKRVLAQVAEGNVKTWNSAVSEHSTLPAANDTSLAVAVAGDLGLVSAPNQAEGANPDVPNAVRAAVFDVAAPGQVHPHVVSDEGTFYLVRLVARSPARTLTLEEADANVRVRVLEHRLAIREQELTERLEKEIPIEINADLVGDLKRGAP